MNSRLNEVKFWRELEKEATSKEYEQVMLESNISPGKRSKLENLNRCLREMGQKRYTEAKKILMAYRFNIENVDDENSAMIKTQLNKAIADLHRELHLITINSSINKDYFDYINEKHEELDKNVSSELYKDSNQELLDIEDQITKFYPSIEELSPDYFAKRPRAKFLLYKKQYLESLQYLDFSKNNLIEDNEKQKKQEDQQKEKEEIKKKGMGARILAMCKNVFHVYDDVWIAIKHLLAKIPLGQVLGDLLGGIMGFVLGGYEGYKGVKSAYKAGKREKVKYTEEEQLLNKEEQKIEKQNKIRIVIGILKSILGIGIIGISVAAAVATFGVSIAGAVFAGFLIPGGLCAIAGLAFLKNAYVLHLARKEEDKAQKDYHDENKALRIAQDSILASFKNDVNSDLKAKFNELTSLQHTVEAKEKIYQEKRNIRLDKEAKVAFKAIEVITLATATVGALLGVAALIGLSVASFGVIPLVLTLVGVGVAVGVKIFEYADEGKGRRYTRKIRGFFENVFDFFTAKKQEEQKIQLEEKPLSKVVSPEKITTKHDHGSTLTVSEKILKPGEIAQSLQHYSPLPTPPPTPPFEADQKDQVEADQKKDQEKESSQESDDNNLHPN